jgi:hypothetical protein
MGDDVSKTHVMTETYLGPDTYVGTAIDEFADDLTVEPVDNTGVFASDTLGDRHRFRDLDFDNRRMSDTELCRMALQSGDSQMFAVF